MESPFNYETPELSTLIEEIIHFNNQRNDRPSEMVKVDIHFKSGKQLSGFPIALNSKNKSENFMICPDLKMQAGHPQSVLVIKKSEIEAIEVHQGTGFFSFFTGEAPHPPGSEANPPTRLTIKKKIKSIQDFAPIKITLNKEMQEYVNTVEEGQKKVYFNLFVEGLQSSLQDIIKDPIGKKALKKFEKIELMMAEDNKVKQKKNGLVILFSPKIKKINFKNFLNDEIDKLL